ncbi:hypothetical protein SAMN05216189_101639 [Pseudomonas delhiensis]|uniref:Uncharacterized protein n=1 Tax=Pseudomonas delhiensis TaxID=366289 RepID=A0A239M2M6_9PSED|nr:hypothetical protein [Pseudomonas delhiensis]SDJ38271.1 hypothetical protein SAMN05216189_101639 [Pseudomonas delhiensis]SNT36368.1 hypothetical protein SAMN06295949_12339 [Pseudomonas delhiensis]
MERLRKVLLASAINETSAVQVLRQAAAEVASPDTAAALLTAAKRLEESADALLQAAHRIELTLHPDAREESLAGLAPLE